jgi:hypothetical protein
MFPFIDGRNDPILAVLHNQAVNGDHCRHYGDGILYVVAQVYSQGSYTPCPEVDLALHRRVRDCLITADEALEIDNFLDSCGVPQDQGDEFFRGISYAERMLELYRRHAA